MKDTGCVNFLQWALPRMQLCWRGFRKVRRQVCKRIGRRLDELGLASTEEYQRYLQEHPAEWNTLRHLCRVTISRFYRDRVLYDFFAADVLPPVCENFRRKGENTIRVWSCGCASGEEPYTIAALWHRRIAPSFPGVSLEIIATDIDPVLIDRAGKACYPAGSMREMPADLLDHAFFSAGKEYCVRRPVRNSVRFLRQDLREESPAGTFQVIFCRNLAFTYFDRRLQEKVRERLARKTERDGILVAGMHELHAGAGPDFVPWIENLPIFQKT
jgi:chemotaxis protein methyltransferase CheR